MDPQTADQPTALEAPPTGQQPWTASRRRPLTAPAKVTSHSLILAMHVRPADCSCIGYHSASPPESIRSQNSQIYHCAQDFQSEREVVCVFDSGAAGIIAKLNSGGSRRRDHESEVVDGKDENDWTRQATQPCSPFRLSATEQ
jgi:hypothetical protein